MQNIPNKKCEDNLRMTLDNSKRDVNSIMIIVKK